MVERPANKGWMYNSNEIFNGYDSSSIHKLNTNFPKGVISCSKSLEGNIGNDTFKILFNEEIDVKIIYLNEIAIMAALGKNKPIYLIPLQQINQNASSALLLMMALSEIFQSPN